MTARQLTVKRSEVEPGESWYAAAVRKCGEGTSTPWAIDLSGDTLVFGVGQGPGDVASIAIRPLTREDFAGTIAWQSMPHVSRWWTDKARTVDDMESHYGKALDGTDPTRLWVVEINDRPCGFLQDYKVGDHPEYALLTALPDAISVDYLIGDPNLVGKGVGTRVMWTFIRDVVAPAYPAATTYFAAPDHRNIASLRMLAKLGFTQGLWFDEPRADGGSDTMIGCSFDAPTVLGPVT
jgi:aminoglycoside 6'-N-acetyltransferase